ncbi:hypothetical protein HCR_22910 (plasmid) [Hydrogenimonas cancrithermarum]|uniref:Helicase ATP-binding domain-containing protein n=2 Tax=Hydrogenimonas cancrithermarum TaxID=2993563 RepID=A0ABM8FNK5_9BACT|nr:hypothetical protein HCR_22910 [Hydrogenimonas cancrithermarum]
MVGASGSGHQSIITCPSSILARQHYNEFKKYAKALGIPIFFFTGDMGKREKNRVKKAALSKENAIFVGTRSLNNLVYSKLGLLIVDEEQKEGVGSKDALLKKSQLLPHQILMSATPIPRTLASTVFSNFEALRINAKPAGRKPIITELIRDK